MQTDKKTTFVTTLNAFKNVRILCAAAFLCALTVVISYLCKFLTFDTSIRITIENLPLILSGYLFGPFIGFSTGIAADFVSTTVFYGIGSINPIIMLGSGFVGLTAGLVSHFVIPKSSKACLPVSVYSAHIIGNMVIKTIGKWVYYRSPLVVLLSNIPIYTIMASIELILLILLLRSKGVKKAIGKLKI